MSDSAMLMRDSSAGPRLRTPGWVSSLAGLGIAVGLVSFIIGAMARNPAPAWRALLINFLFWTSLAQGAVMWGVIFRIARAGWSPAVNRIAQAAVWFLPFTVAVFVVLFFGRRFYIPWIHSDLGGRAVWLNVPSLFLRDGLALVVVVCLSWAFVYTYVRADQAGVRPGVTGTREGEAPERASRRLSVLGVILAFVYGIAYTLFGFDLVMALTPQWYSTLFGWYFCLGGLYAGMAAVIVIAIAARRWLGVSDMIGKSQLRDLGNLLLAFAMAMTYFFYSQALPIWYENLPPETSFAIPRAHFQPWQTLSWIVVFSCYLGVFALLVIREMKENARTLVAVALFAAAAMWLERYLLVAPSLVPRSEVFPAQVLLVGAGFAGVFVLSVMGFLARHPRPSPLDLVLQEERDRWQ